MQAVHVFVIDRLDFLGLEFTDLFLDELLFRICFLFDQLLFKHSVSPLKGNFFFAFVAQFSTGTFKRLFLIQCGEHPKNHRLVKF